MSSCPSKSAYLIVCVVLTLDRYVKKYSETTDAYKVDVDKYPTARAYFQVTTTPCILVYKSGTQLAKVEQMNQGNMKDINNMLSATS